MTQTLKGLVPKSVTSSPLVNSGDMLVELVLSEMAKSRWKLSYLVNICKFLGERGTVLFRHGAFYNKEFAS